MQTHESKFAPPILLERISDYVGHYASVAPTEEVVICGDLRWTYRELSQRVDALAKALLASGVRPGDRVATLCTPHPDYFVVFLAAASIGAIWIGLNPRYKLQELRYVLGDAAPVFLFARGNIKNRSYEDELTAFAQEFTDLKIVLLDGKNGNEKWPSLQVFLAGAATITDAALLQAKAKVSADNPALIVYTSGTTGFPKGALLPHRGLVRCCRVQARFIQPKPYRILNNLPINHIGCVGDISCCALVVGGTIVFTEKFDPEGSLQIIQKERITFWGQVPTMFQLSLSVPNFTKYDLSSLQAIFWSGAAAPRQLAERLAQMAPLLGCSYGMTETVGSVTFAVGKEDLLEVLVESVGWPVEEYEMRITDGEGNPVKPGESGEIQVRGDFIFKGYWNRPEATAETIDSQGWLHSGDLAFERPDGTYQLVGRLKEMFKSGGYNVYPREIEKVIEGYAGVMMCAVLGVRDDLYGEVGHAYVLVPEKSDVTEAKLREHCRKNLANYKVPKAFFLTTNLPMLPIGKIDRHTLKQQINDEH